MILRIQQLMSITQVYTLPLLYMQHLWRNLLRVAGQNTIQHDNWSTSIPSHNRLSCSFIKSRMAGYQIGRHQIWVYHP